MKTVAAMLIIGAFVSQIIAWGNWPTCREGYAVIFSLPGGWSCLAGYKP